MKESYGKGPEFKRSKHHITENTIGGGRERHSANMILESVWLPLIASIQPVSGGRFPAWLIVLAGLVVLGIAGALTLRGRGEGTIPLAPPDPAPGSAAETDPPEAEPDPHAMPGPDSPAPSESAPPAPSESAPPAPSESAPPAPPESAPPPSEETTQ